MSIDYKELLKKYVRHVFVCEGADYTGNECRHDCGDEIVFTDEEWEFLQTVSKEHGNWHE